MSAVVGPDDVLVAGPPAPPPGQGGRRRGPETNGRPRPGATPRSRMHPRALSYGTVKTTSTQ